MLRRRIMGFLHYVLCGQVRHLSVLELVLRHNTASSAQLSQFQLKSSEPKNELQIREAEKNETTKQKVFTTPARQLLEASMTGKQTH